MPEPRNVVLPPRLRGRVLAAHQAHRPEPQPGSFLKLRALLEEGWSQASSSAWWPSVGTGGPTSACPRAGDSSLTSRLGARPLVVCRPGEDVH